MRAKLSDDENDVYAEIIQKRIDDAMKKQLMEIIESFADVNASYDVSYATSSNVKGFDIGNIENFEKLVKKVEKIEKCDRDNMNGEYLGLLRNYGLYRMMGE